MCNEAITFLFAATESVLASLRGGERPRHDSYNSDGPRMTVPMIRAKVVNIAAITVTIQPVTSKQKQGDEITRR